MPTREQVYQVLIVDSINYQRTTIDSTKVNRRQRGTRVRLPKVNRRQRGTRYDSPKSIVSESESESE